MTITDELRIMADSLRMMMPFQAARLDEIANRLDGDDAPPHVLDPAHPPIADGQRVSDQ